jgi:hypothetical protein
MDVSRDAKASSRVAGSAWAMRPDTGAPPMKLRPKSPVRIPCRKPRY